MAMHCIQSNCDSIKFDYHQIHNNNNKFFNIRNSVSANIENINSNSALICVHSSFENMLYLFLERFILAKKKKITANLFFTYRIFQFQFTVYKYLVLLKLNLLIYFYLYMYFSIHIIVVHYKFFQLIYFSKISLI